MISYAPSRLERGMPQQQLEGPHGLVKRDGESGWSLPSPEPIHGDASLLQRARLEAAPNLLAVRKLAV